MEERGRGETWRQVEHSRNSYKRAAGNNEHLRRRGHDTGTRVFGKKTHIAGGKGGDRTETQDDSKGPHQGGCGLHAEGLEDAGEPSGELAADVWSGVRESLMGR